MRVKRVLRMIFSRLTVALFAIALQIWFVVMVVTRLDVRYRIVEVVIRIATVVLVIWIINTWMNPSYKLLWTILILAAPIFGVVLYYLIGQSRLSRNMRERYLRAQQIAQPLLKEKSAVRNMLRDDTSGALRQSRYLSEQMGFPAYHNTETVFFPVGEDMFGAMKQEMRKAQHFIFIEYFIIAQGQMWDETLQILTQKVKEGVDVRLIYDDVGSIGTVPMAYFKKMRALGIKCCVFNRFIPVASIVLNNRDHRKILVIDGHTAFTGGINFADEYINRTDRFGHWKDNGVMLHGEGAFSFTVMFLQMWSVVTKSDKELLALTRYAWDTDEVLENDAPFGTHHFHEEKFLEDGIVQPYCDTPLDNETVGENVYLSIISQARRYVWVYTPYLMIDNEMMTALTIARKSGVDVRIVTPGIPDKKIAYLLTRSYYSQLIQAGVKVYEYTPGFIHAKTVIADDKIATVGTINMDYRSLYLHFECGVWMYRTSAIAQIRADFLDTFEKSRIVTLDWVLRRNIFLRLTASVLKPLAPLL